MPSNYKERIFHALRRMTRANLIHSRELENRLSITGPQIVVLWQLKQDSPCMPSELARRVSLSQATISGILDRLEKAGLVSRARHKSDRRRVVVQLTPAGKTVAEGLPFPLHSGLTAGLERLSAEEKDAVTSILEQVADMMGA